MSEEQEKRIEELKDRIIKLEWMFPHVTDRHKIETKDLQAKLTTLKAEIARVKESWDKTAWENTSLIQKKGELEEEIKQNEYPFQSAVTFAWFSDINEVNELATIRINGKRYRICAEENLIELPGEEKEELT